MHIELISLDKHKNNTYILRIAIAYESMEEGPLKRSSHTEAKNKRWCRSSSKRRNNWQSTNPQTFEILAQTPFLQNDQDMRMMTKLFNFSFCLSAYYNINSCIALYIYTILSYIYVYMHIYVYLYNIIKLVRNKKVLLVVEFIVF